MSDDFYSDYTDSTTEDDLVRDEQNMLTEKRDQRSEVTLYAVLALQSARLAVVSLENDLSQALAGVRRTGVGLDEVFRVQSKLDKARNQLTLIEREYVRYGG